MPPKSPESVVLTFGRFIGRRLDEVGRVDPGYVAALARSPGAPAHLTAAARMVSDALARTGALTPALLDAGRTKVRDDLASPARAPQPRPTRDPTSVLISTRWLFRILGRGRPRGTTIERTDAGFDLVHAGGTRSFSLDDLGSVTVRSGFLASALVIAQPGGESFEITGLARRRALSVASEITARIAHRRRLRACLPRLREALAQFDQICARDRYFNERALERWTTGAADIRSLLGELEPAEISADAMPEIRRFEECVQEGRAQVDARNEAWVARQLVVWQRLFDEVEKSPLTEQQRLAVLHDEDRVLVVAGAGTGKTSVVVAKVAHLLEAELARADEILLLTYSAKASKDMKERLAQRIGATLEVRTFHGLGKRVIAEVEGVQSSLSKMAEDDDALLRAIDVIFTDLFVQDETFREKAQAYFLEYFAPYRSRFDCVTLGDYFRYLRDHEVRSLQNDKVKSFEECTIANFLFLNGVRHIYEHKYPHDTRTSLFRQYKPDFFLPDYGIYIEHYALDRDGNTPPFIDRQKYVDGVAFKARIHAEHATTLVTTYSYEKREGVLLSNLAAKLRDLGVVFQPRAPAVILAEFNKQQRRLTRLMATFLNLFKSQGLAVEALVDAVGEPAELERQTSFCWLFGKVYEGYQDRLRRDDDVDFHDLIVKAAGYIEGGKYVSRFRYVIVDEFQDMAHGPRRLVQALLRHDEGPRLFAVGDDWQAIYHFMGGDLSLMTDFERHFGFTKRVLLDETFRFSDQLAELSSRFVLENPKQIRKVIRSRTRAMEPSVRFVPYQGAPSAKGTTEAHATAAEAASAAVDAALSGILDEIDPRAHSDEDVLLLGRYDRCRPRSLAALARRFPRLRFMTVHGSKGLEAEIVVVLDLCGGKLGFPSEMTDDPLLDLVRPDGDSYPKAEERRLFYVALTRARRRVYLLGDLTNPSSFTDELEDVRYGLDDIARANRSLPSCAICKKGWLVLRSGPSGKFVGCTNFPLCEFTESACPTCRIGVVVRDPERLKGSCSRAECAAEVRLCSTCRHGWLSEKSGKYGSFLGCSNYASDLTCRGKS